MKKLIATVLSAALFSSLIISCNSSSTSSLSGYTKSKNDLEYKIIKGSNGVKAKEGDYVKYTSSIRNLKGELIFTTTGAADLVATCNAPRMKGDAQELFTFMCVGDSASAIIPESQFFGLANRPSNIKEGEKLMLDVKLNGIYTKDQYINEVKPALEGAKYANETKLLTDFIASKGWTATRTESGLYIVIDEQGNGAKLEKGKQAKMNYTGSLLNGNKFDSNVDPAFGHVQPFEFVLGQGQVIRGWDEGIPYFNVGGKGKLIIPARLGYGEQGQEKIPANSPLVFEVEVLGVSDAPAREPMSMNGM